MAIQGHNIIELTALFNGAFNASILWYKIFSLLSGLAFAVASLLFNVGVEGQPLRGHVAAYWVCHRRST